MVKILVVEDEWIVADQLCASLRKMGYLVPLTMSSYPIISGRRPSSPVP